MGLQFIRLPSLEFRNSEKIPFFIYKEITPPGLKITIIKISLS